ncbi:SIMPL domain-containing protein [Cyanothece sp. BG0011]|uniref:SIMPL domain-containing protein n=1 Tax=Cyanothece sp. BG0011 TaxID=2082950 RepID=UPI000D1EAA02|nr:SIMPL domain-containing protein [Cyanothece sp. BG0011]
MKKLVFPLLPVILTLVTYPVINIPFMTPVMAQEQVLRTLTVTGKGTVRIPTSLTDVSLGVEIQGKTAAEVQQNVAQRTSSLVDFLRSRQVERLETTGIRLQPNYQYDNNQRRLVGYLGTNIVSFRVKTEEVGSLLDDAVKAGATRIDRVSFSATETAISEAQKEALKLATSDAQAQAEAVLSTLNFQSQEIISISINGANEPQPLVRQTPENFRTASAVADSTPVIGGEQTIEAMVTLQMRY